MNESEIPIRDVDKLVVPEVGRLHETGDPGDPYQLLDPDGLVVWAVAWYFAELQAQGKPATTLRSYGMDLLRWYRFLWALGISWDRASRTEARDFARWLQIADKPVRVHWRHQRKGLTAEDAAAKPRPTRRPAPGTPNPVTGKPTPGSKFAATTRAHAKTALRIFYDTHAEAGTGPILNPFPLDRSRRAARANGHHNPMDPFKNERMGRYRPKVPKRIPKRIPDELFNHLFASLKYNRDRALLAFWVSTGARAEELLTCRQKDPLPGEQLIGVIRKGSRVYQRLPASADAFVWLRLYQEECRKFGIPQGRQEALWWTLRRPWRPLLYPAARAMFVRTNEVLGANWTLHDLRHTASYRMARDPEMPLTDVQWVLGHAQLSTTQIYLPASEDEVIASVLAHHARQQALRDNPPAPVPSPRYNPESMHILFGGRP